VQLPEDNPHIAYASDGHGAEWAGAQAIAVVHACGSLADPFIIDVHDGIRVDERKALLAASDRGSRLVREHELCEVRAEGLAFVTVAAGGGVLTVSNAGDEQHGAEY
jgi:hypothetical protein